MLARPSLLLRVASSLTSTQYCKLSSSPSYTLFNRRRFANMAQTPSKACCNTPPIVASGYQPQGQYTTVDGMKTYTTGPSDATRGLLVIYDIFGFWPQTIQGADILAHSDDHKKYRVFMPDFFEGQPADITWFPPDTKEKEQKLGAFFGAQGAPPKTVPRIPKVINELKAKHPNIKEWATVGYCWGGKIVSLNSGSGTPFKAAIACHPAMVDPNDATGVTIPYLMLPSKDEEKKDVDAFKANLKVPHEIEWYSDQQHGFLAARGDLQDKNVVAAYEKGYQKMLTFLHEHMLGSDSISVGALRQKCSILVLLYQMQDEIS